MEKRVLMAATVPSMIGHFNMNNIAILQEMGFVVDVACDYTDESIWPAKKTKELKEQLETRGVTCIQIDFSRSPFDVKRHVESYKKLKKIISDRQYKFIHTHTPIASAIIRIVAHKLKTKVIYTAHGFHFYKGAPIKNWLCFYPVEKHLSRFTDVLITINKEDYNRAKKEFHAKKTVYVPGVGVDTEKFSPRQSGRERIRAELGMENSQTMLLSVGELNENKNHSSVIRAIAGMNLTYVIVGKGEKRDYLEALAQETGVDVRLVGFRTDVADFYNAADIYILPSIREGLNVSLMEAMASGLPVACGRIRGNTDLITDEGCLFDPNDIDEIKKSIEYTTCNKQRIGRQNLQKIGSFDLQAVESTICEVYRALNY